MLKPSIIVVTNMNNMIPLSQSTNACKHKIFVDAYVYSYTLTGIIINVCKRTINPLCGSMSLWISHICSLSTLNEGISPKSELKNWNENEYSKFLVMNRGKHLEMGWSRYHMKKALIKYK